MGGTNQLVPLLPAGFNTSSVSAGKTEFTDPETRILDSLALKLLALHPSLNVALRLRLRDA
jgi:hypothetical protein